MSVILQVLLVAFSNSSLMPKVYPTRIAQVINTVLQSVTIVFTALQVSIFAVVSAVPILVFGVVVMMLAVTSPLIGLVENRRRTRGDEVYSLSSASGGNRLPSHLLTNVLGALAIVALYGATKDAAGFGSYRLETDGDAAFNIVLPMTTIVILAFIRWQQQDIAFPEWVGRQTAADLSSVDATQSAPESLDDMENPTDAVRGYSLADGHQLANVIYLVFATFMLSSTAIYLAGFTITRAKAGQPIPFTWHITVAAAAFLAFLLTCGLSPYLQRREAVYMNFLMGVPAGLAIAVTWLSWLEPGRARDLTALSVVIVGHLSYCAAVLRTVKRTQNKIPLHYFSTTVISFFLIILVAATYVS